MNKKYISMIVGLILIVVIGSAVYFNKKPAYQASVNTQQADSSATASASFTMAQVSAHATRESCWTTISGGVYDMTSWIPKHPGGEKPILSLCGVDGTSAFTNQHGRSSKIARVLGGFKIGVLAN